MNEQNVSNTVSLVSDLLDSDFLYSSKLIICQLIYSSFISQRKSYFVYFDFIKIFEGKHNIINVFTDFLLWDNLDESFFLLEKMIENKLIDSKVVKLNNSLYFRHHNIDLNLNFYKDSDFYIYFCQNEHNLKENNWELHKQLVKEGVNPNAIAKIIRNDEIGKLQEISSQTNFDFNQRIAPSLYERYSYINYGDISIINFAAFFSSVKCFKFLLMNGAKVTNTGKYAVAGGNEEIIHLCEQNHSSFQNAYEAAIKFHQNDIFKYFYERKIEKINNLEELGVLCVKCSNFEILSFLIDEGINISNKYIIDEYAKIGNIFLIKQFLAELQMPYDILIYSSESPNFELVKYIISQNEIDINDKNKNGWTALIIASSNGYTEIVKLLLEQEGIDINTKNKFGFTALMYASSNGYIEIVKLLLEQEGIDINAKDKYGKTALTLASANGHTEIVKLLSEKGTN